MSDIPITSLHRSEAWALLVRRGLLVHEPGDRGPWVDRGAVRPWCGWDLLLDTAEAFAWFEDRGRVTRAQ